MKLIYVCIYFGICTSLCGMCNVVRFLTQFYKYNSVNVFKRGCWNINFTIRFREIKRGKHTHIHISMYVTTASRIYGRLFLLKVYLYIFIFRRKYSNKIRDSKLICGSSYGFASFFRPAPHKFIEGTDYNKSRTFLIISDTWTLQCTIVSCINR